MKSSHALLLPGLAAVAVAACGGAGASQNDDANFTDELSFEADGAIVCQGDNDKYSYGATITSDDNGALVEFKHTAVYGISTIAGHAAGFAGAADEASWTSESSSALMASLSVSSDGTGELVRKGKTYAVECRQADADLEEPGSLRLANTLVEQAKAYSGYAEGILEELDATSEISGEENNISRIKLAVVTFPDDADYDEWDGECDENTAGEYLAGESDPEGASEALREAGWDAIEGVLWGLSDGDSWGEWVQAATDGLDPATAMLSSLREGETIRWQRCEHVAALEGVEGLSDDEVALQVVVGNYRFLIAGATLGFQE